MKGSVDGLVELLLDNELANKVLWGQVKQATNEDLQYYIFLKAFKCLMLLSALDHKSEHTLISFLCTILIMIRL